MVKKTDIVREAVKAGEWKNWRLQHSCSLPN